MASKIVVAAASRKTEKPEELVLNNNTENAVIGHRLGLLLQRISDEVRMRPGLAAEIWASVRKTRR